MNVSKWFLLSLMLLTVNVQSEILSTDSQDAQLKLGLELIQQKNYQQAEDHFQKLKLQYPSQVTYLNNLAVAQMAQGKTEQALESLKAAMISDKQFSVTQKNISQIYAYMAAQAYAKALDKKVTAQLPGLDSIVELKAAQQEPQTIVVSTDKNQQKKSDAEITSQLTVVLSAKVESWAKAWMKGDVKSYLATYSEKFQPGGNLSYQDWLAQRRYRLRNSKQVVVSYTEVDVYFNAEKDSALIEFTQKYQTDTYQDQVRKQLYWSLENQTWLITREQVTEKL
ncbi:MAG: tetratricopeptide repeat protein [Gammaproteobacteria bacterium]|nr:tetratricopeptide repeat protein [Gammaproteobacteria bacterium]